MTEITTPRLRLRVPRIDDAGWILALNQDPLWVRFIGNRGVDTIESAQKYAEAISSHHAQHGYGLLVIEEQGTGTPMGMCGLIYRGIFDYPDLGYALMPQHRGKGVALEAARGVVQWARESGQYTHVTAMTHSDNIASQRLLTELGFQRMGTIAIKDIPPQRFYRLAVS